MQWIVIDCFTFLVLFYYWKELHIAHMEIIFIEYLESQMFRMNLYFPLTSY